MQLVFLAHMDAHSCRALRRQLEECGYRVRAFLTGDGVIRQAEEMSPCLIVLMPGNDGSGFELCRRLRRNSFLADTPVVFLVDENAEEARILALEAGADDCMTESVNLTELLVRLQALLRRSEHPTSAAFAESPSVLRLGRIEIDRDAMKLLVRGSEVTTTTLEFRLMEYLARHEGRVFTRDQLLDAVWGDTRFVTPRTVDACVRRIRRKIEPVSPNPTFLKTVRGVGYRFEA